METQIRSKNLDGWGKRTGRDSILVRFLSVGGTGFDIGHDTSTYTSSEFLGFNSIRRKKTQANK